MQNMWPTRNTSTPTFWPMQNIEADLSDISASISASTVFAIIYFCCDYWKAPLYPDCQHFFAFMTSEGVVMPTRTTQGGFNSTVNFQKKVDSASQIYVTISKHGWMIQLSLQLMSAKCSASCIVSSKYDFLSVPKFAFFQSEAHWCRRIIDANGVRFNPKNISGLTNSPQHTERGNYANTSMA